MALLTKKEFAAACGMESKQISVYEKRRKIVVEGDYINDSVEPNLSFILKRKNMLTLKSARAEVNETAPKTASAGREKLDLSHITEEFLRSLEEHGTHVTPEFERDLAKVATDHKTKLLPTQFAATIYADALVDLCEYFLRREVAASGGELILDRSDLIAIKGEFEHIARARISECRRQMDMIAEEIVEDQNPVAQQK